jgi:DNA-binding NarL/FixJ family response regulator
MTETSPITVVIGSFEDLIARGLRGLIEDDPSLELVLADIVPARMQAALQACRARVAILDARTIGSPVDVRELAARCPFTQLVLLAGRPSSVECAQLLAFGAAACLDTTTQARDVLSAIHLASRGLQLIPSDAHGNASGVGLLTSRESDVLSELQRRRTNAQIAADLNISIETVRTHARHIYRKFGVGSRRELVAPAPDSLSRTA